jgi:hypothetical protein
LEDGILLNPDLHDEVANNTCVDKLSSAILEIFAVFTPKSHPIITHGPVNRLALRRKYARNIG